MVYSPEQGGSSADLQLTYALETIRWPRIASEPERLLSLEMRAPLAVPYRSALESGLQNLAYDERRGSGTDAGRHIVGATSEDIMRKHAIGYLASLHTKAEDLVERLGGRVEPVVIIEDGVLAPALSEAPALTSMPYAAHIVVLGKMLLEHSSDFTKPRPAQQLFVVMHQCVTADR